MERNLRKTNPAVSTRIRSLRKEIAAEFGVATRLITAVLGPFMAWSAGREEKRLLRGVAYEPEMIVEQKNWV